MFYGVLRISGSQNWDLENITNSKDTDFPDLLTKIDATNIDRWYTDMLRVLSNSPWEIDGCSIVNLYNKDNYDDANYAYRVCQQKLAAHLYTKL